MHCSSNSLPLSPLLLQVKTTQAMDHPSHRNLKSLETKPASMSKEKQSMHRCKARAGGPLSHSAAAAIYSPC